MLLDLRIYFMFQMINWGLCDMEGRIVGGEASNILDYPYTAYLSTKCVTNGRTEYYTCGSSILNDKVLLTAAHCSVQCQKTYMVASMGASNKYEGMHISCNAMIIHDLYQSNTLVNDVAVVAIAKKLRLNRKISRIAVMKNPPYDEQASVAGWGMTSESDTSFSDNLMNVVQYKISDEDCINLIRKKPKGTLCASSGEKGNYAAAGDSGSALIVRSYIQIGIVSHKIPIINKEIVVYTDVGYFYNWITAMAEAVYC